MDCGDSLKDKVGELFIEAQSLVEFDLLCMHTLTHTYKNIQYNNSPLKTYKLISMLNLIIYT